MRYSYHSSWESILGPALQQESMATLLAWLEHQRAVKDIFPAADLVFNAFALTPLTAVKVVILGQDPYHNYGQAHGLSFSVPPGMALPPSLKNIFTELVDDIPGLRYPSQGDLTAWAQQGVLLLNATLTVEAHQAGSHQKLGWEQFTDSIIQQLAQREEPLVFILWGAYAQKKARFLDPHKHAILNAVHPSPLSAYRGFFGSKPFSQANAFLTQKGIPPIDWSL